MKIFLIEIGITSRRGNFEKLFQKVVSVPDKCGDYAISKYFSEKYEGFNVRVFPIREVTELSDPTTPSNQERKDDAGQRETEYFLHFRVKYTEQEKKLYQEYRDFTRKADEALRYLHNSIEERFGSLSYSGISNKRHLELKTDYHDGTYCHKFPINGVIFEAAAKKAEEDYTPDPPSDLLEAPEPPPPPLAPSGIESKDPDFGDVPF
jgi:hypothetical protein